MQTVLNGRMFELDPNRLERNLLDFLREELDLTGAKRGCNVGACGTCTILINTVPRQACQLKVGDIIDKKVLTIEGLADPDGTLHPLQQAFIDHGAIQCGFCTPGMVLRAYGLLLKNRCPSREEISRAISPNLCRCTGYQQIIDAVEAAASETLLK